MFIVPRASSTHEPVNVPPASSNLVLLGEVVVKVRTIQKAYAPSMPPLLSLPLSMAYDDSDGCVTMAMMTVSGFDKDEILCTLAWRPIAVATVASVSSLFISVIV
nr:hypothetical protein [Tanacetum cinerariifolium]